MKTLMGLLPLLLAAAPAGADGILFTNSEIEQWRVVNDTVMGGRSSSRMYHRDGIGVFEGEVSLRNNGGFASVRRYMATSFNNADLVSITVKGDGRRYQLRLGTPYIYRSMAYVVEFDTVKDTWVSLSFEPTDFNVRYRGRFVSGAPVIKFSDTERVGLMIADKNEGPFKLEIKSIQTLKNI